MAGDCRKFLRSGRAPDPNRGENARVAKTSPDLGAELRPGYPTPAKGGRRAPGSPAPLFHSCGGREKRYKASGSCLAASPPPLRFMPPPPTLGGPGTA